MEALIVFAKLPVPGQVKTRLTPALTPEEAALLYEAFLKDALAQYLRLPVSVRLYLQPSAQPVPPGLIPDGAGVFTQEGAGLGARMQRAFLETFAAGFERAVIVGTDHPTLPSAFVQVAFDALAEPLSVCVGPSEDGGYYLLGMNEFYPTLFEGMAYSHPGVFAETLERIDGTGASLTILPTVHDVDTPEDVARLYAEAEREGAALLHTRPLLQALAGVYPWMAAGARPG